MIIKMQDLQNYITASGELCKNFSPSTALRYLTFTDVIPARNLTE